MAENLLHQTIWRNLVFVRPLRLIYDDLVAHERDKANKIISDLRNQNASQLARAARKNDVESHGRLLRSLVIPSGSMADHFPIDEVFVQSLFFLEEEEVG